MSPYGPLICADCGIPMNHHADKLNLTAAQDDPGAIDADLGGVVEEAHTCPGCGRAEARILRGGTPAAV